MNQRILCAVAGFLLPVAAAGCAERTAAASLAEPDDPRASLRSALQTLSQESSDALFRLHFRSIIAVTDAGDGRAGRDAKVIKRLWQAFQEPSAATSPRLRESYPNRSLQLIIAWVSPTDSQVSLAWLRLPAGWDPAQEYPLYVQLHGLWDVAEDRLAYLSYPFLHPATTSAFEDGYLISPWGRGNRWYRGIAEADVLECIATIRSLVRVDQSRQYLCGHSMGGYGAWHLARQSPDTWAALGIHAGALRDDSELSATAVAPLRRVPTYFAVGVSDDLFSLNLLAYQSLRAAGNRNASFVTFSGGHDYRLVDVEKMYRWMRRFDRDDRAQGE